MSSSTPSAGNTVRGARSVQFSHGSGTSQTTSWGWPVESDPACWGRACPECEEPRKREPFQTGYTARKHQACDQCLTEEGQNRKLAGDVRLTVNTEVRLADGLEALPKLDWWHSTSYLGDDFSVDAVGHVGELAAAQHRLVGEGALGDARRQRGPISRWPALAHRDLYRVRLRPDVVVSGPVVVELNATPVEFLTQDVDVDVDVEGRRPAAGLAVPYLNRNEAPGTLSLWLGSGCIADVTLVAKAIQIKVKKNPMGFVEPEIAW